MKSLKKYPKWREKAYYKFKDDIHLVNILKSFDERIKLYFDTIIRTSKKTALSKIEKNRRLAYIANIRLSLLWACFEILYNFCKEHDEKYSNNRVFLTKKSQESKSKRDKVRGYYQGLKTSDDLKYCINLLHSNLKNILTDKNNNYKERLENIKMIDDLLKHLINVNTQIEKTDYNVCIEGFKREIDSICTVMKFNHNRRQCNQKEYVMEHMSFDNFLGTCYTLRNHFLHNGLMFEDNKIFFKFLNILCENLEKFILTFYRELIKRVS